ANGWVFSYETMRCPVASRRCEITIVLRISLGSTKRMHALDAAGSASLTMRKSRRPANASPQPSRCGPSRPPRSPNTPSENVTFAGSLPDIANSSHMDEAPARPQRNRPGGDSSVRLEVQPPLALEAPGELLPLDAGPRGDVAQRL